MPYGDYVGMVYADFPMGTQDIEKFAQDLKIETKGRTFIGFQFEADENHFREKPVKIHLSLLVVLDEEWKDKYPNFGQYRSRNELLSAKRIPVEVDFYDFFTNYLKRFWGRMVWASLGKERIDITDLEKE
jgi:hypothetical protein